MKELAYRQLPKGKQRGVLCSLKAMSSLGRWLMLLWISLISYGCGYHRHFQEPDYTLLKQDGDIAIRDYAPALVAEVVVDGNREEAAYQAFSILVDYIQGANQKQQAISMTTPVIQQPSVHIQRQQRENERDNAWRIGFYLPATFSAEDSPTPDDQRIVLRRIPKTRFASIRFSGRHSDNNFYQHASMLRRYLLKQTIPFDEPPIFAYYDSPFTPWFLRRNEVLYSLPPSSFP
ncbi:MAG: heme-binding protein [Alphaproteobacteria bacterium GM7ARS4]|nr:heme-binding protein [Alphaproteobacteria bacterium GM7ARS4]